MEQNRINHILAVADKMRENAEKFRVDPDDAYLVGYLHDIGYEYIRSMHNRSGGLILEKNGFRHWKEIYYHGEPNSPYKFAMLDLLNWADMQTDYDGTDVTFKERLQHIAERYGEKSEQYKNAVIVIENIKKLTELY